MARDNGLPASANADQLQDQIAAAIKNGRRRKLRARIIKAITHPTILAQFLAQLVRSRFFHVETNEHGRAAVQTNHNRRTTESRAQSCQDMFVLEMLQKKRNGWYVEVGAGDPFAISNTFVLETQYGWRGLSLEIDKATVRAFNAVRKNQCLARDATSFEYEHYLSAQGFPSQIDYLSVDIEPAYQTLAALNALPLDRYRFSVITFEHDLYRDGPEYMNLSRKLLASLGYELVAKNISVLGQPFEDWYVDPRVVPESTWRQFCSSNMEGAEILSRVRSHVPTN